MFTSETTDERVFAIKPMNCPGHVQIFKNDLRSYRELPYRLAEFGKVHRYEPSGALHGLMRVRAFTQDDAHIFCTEDQITAETGAVCNLLLGIYRDFGFDDVIIKFADRPERRVGSDEVWDRAEAALKRAMDSLGLDYTLQQGRRRVLRSEDRVRAARCHRARLAVRHVTGRPQLTGPARRDLHRRRRRTATRQCCCTARSSARSSASSAFSLEHYAGALPFWLAPDTDRRRDDHVGCGRLCRRRRQPRRARQGCAREVDLRNEKINYKVREHSLAKIPVIIALGKREVAEGTVALRRLGQQGQRTLPLAQAVEELHAEAESRSSGPREAAA